MEPRTFQLPFILLFVVLSTSTFSVADVLDKLQETIVEPLKDSIPSKGGKVEQVRKAVPVINTQNRSAHNATQDTVQSITSIFASSENTAIPKGVDIPCCTANCPIGTCPDHPFLNASNDTQLPTPDTGIELPCCKPECPDGSCVVISHLDATQSRRIAFLPTTRIRIPCCSLGCEPHACPHRQLRDSLPRAFFRQQNSQQQDPDLPYCGGDASPVTCLEYVSELFTALEKPLKIEVGTKKHEVPKGPCCGAGCGNHLCLAYLKQLVGDLHKAIQCTIDQQSKMSAAAMTREESRPERRNPNFIPVIFQSASGTPYTVPAKISLPLSNNYISAAALSKLGLHHHSSALVEPVPAFLPGRVVECTESIELALLAGRSNNKFEGVQFHVFDAVESEIVIGSQFLREAFALGLTEEYIGVEGGELISGLKML